VATVGPTSAYYQQLLGELATAVEALDATDYARSTGDRWRVLRTGVGTDPRHLTAAILPGGPVERRGTVLHLGIAVQWWAQLDGADALRDVARVLAASHALHTLLRTWGGTQGERIIDVAAQEPERGTGWAQYTYTGTLLVPLP
jgi:hypothetical protein